MESTMVRLTRPDGSEVEFATRRAGWRELTPTQEKDLARLFAWCDKSDRAWDVRMAREVKEALKRGQTRRAHVIQRLMRGSA